MSRCTFNIVILLGEGKSSLKLLFKTYACLLKLIKNASHFNDAEFYIHKVLFSSGNFVVHRQEYVFEFFYKIKKMLVLPCERLVRAQT